MMKGIKTITFLVFSVLSIQLFAQSPKLDFTSSRTVDVNSPNEYDGFELVWNDEFNHTGHPSELNWGFEYGFVRNYELQWYQPQNAVCKDGRLLIEGKRERVGNPNYNEASNDWRSNRAYAEYTSACIKTRRLQEWEAGGYYEVRARIDTTQGSWPAIWLLGTEGHWPQGGEIDIMEFYRSDEKPSILANAAWGTSQRYVAKWDSSLKPLSWFLEKDKDWVEKYHVWSMYWDENIMEIYLDGELLNSIDLSGTINPDGTNPFAPGKKFYLLLNLAIGSNGGNPLLSETPFTYEVDYVRVYKNN
jgi:beta-glucanase (GH16 family)